jgi:hypothetical protein
VHTLEGGNRPSKQIKYIHTVSLCLLYCTLPRVRGLKACACAPSHGRVPACAHVLQSYLEFGA